MTLSRNWLGSLIVAAITVSATTASAAKVFTILVGEKGTPALENAEKLANGETVFAENKIHKALGKFEEIAKGCPICPQPRVYNMPDPKCDLDPATFCEVNIKVAGGEFAGKGGKGSFEIPGIIATEVTLRLLGGYDDTFKTRNPFNTPTMIQGFVMDGKNHALRELTISGFFMDTQGTNTHAGHVTLGYLKTNRLVFADNTFVNGGLGGIAPLIRAKTPEAEVVVRNNFFINNRVTMEADCAGWQNTCKLYTIEGNSFLGNHPLNPDPTSGTTAAMFIKENKRVGKVLVAGNLFVYNPGGAINPHGPNDKGPIELKDNLFFENGDLFGEKAPGAAAIVVKWGGFKSDKIPWNLISLDLIEDDYEWKNSGNVALDPKITFDAPKGGWASSYDVKATAGTENKIRSLVGANLKGTSLTPTNAWGPKKFDPTTLPFPQEPKAVKYGVDPKRVEQF